MTVSPGHRTRLVAVVVVPVLLGGLGMLLRGASTLTSIPDRRLILDRAEINLGPLVTGQLVKTSVRATNAGAEPLLIADFQGGCRCVAEMGDPKPLLPGESRDITIALDTTIVPDGAFTRWITFTVNGRPSNDTIVLRGKVEQEFEVSPAMIDFGAVAQGSSARQAIAVLARRSGVTFTDITTTNDAVSVRVLRGPPHRLRAVALVRRTTEPGEHYGVLIIRTTSEFNPEIRLPVLVTIGDKH